MRPSLPSPHPWRWLILIFLVLLALVYSSDFLEFDQDGEPVLAPLRRAKLERELAELEHAEQYALVAARDGEYPCYSCPEKNIIFLRRGMVFKYGVTRKGETLRYGTWHIDRNLLYVIQFQGNWQACLAEEKKKIYLYATLPENLSRPVPLIRPPGNKVDH